MKSIRTFLQARLIAGSALVLAAGAAAAGLVVTRAIEAQFDRNLEVRVQGLASLLFQVEDQVEFEFSVELMPEYERSERPDYFELWFDDGTVLERSESLRRLDLALAEPATARAHHWDAPLPDGRPGRYAAQQIEVPTCIWRKGPTGRRQRVW